MNNLNNFLIYSPVIDTVNIFLKVTIENLKKNNINILVMFNPLLTLNYSKDTINYKKIVAKGNNNNPFSYFSDFIFLSKSNNINTIIFIGSTTIILATFIKLFNLKKRIIYILHGTLRSKGYFLNLIFLFFLVTSNLCGIEIYSVNNNFRKYFFRKKYFKFIGQAGVGIDKHKVDKLIKVRKEFCITKSTYTIAFIGRHEISKGYDLFESISKINKNPNYKFISIGGFTKKSSNSVLQYGPLDNVDLINLLKNIDLLILPSISEGLGMSMVECCIAGIPTIATNTDGSKQFLNNNIGIILDNRNPEDFLIAINKILNNLNFYISNCIRYSTNNNNFISKPFINL